MRYAIPWLGGCFEGRRRRFCEELSDDGSEARRFERLRKMQVVEYARMVDRETDLAELPTGSITLSECDA